MAYEPSNGGNADDAKATNSTGSWSLTSLQKYAVDLLNQILNKQSTDPSTATKQDTGNTALTSLNTAIGAPADTAATTDTGTFSLIALFKRLLGKFPTLVTGRWPVDGSGVTQPVSLSSVPLATDAATATNQATANTSLSNIDADLGSPADAKATDSSSSWSIIAILKGLWDLVNTKTATSALQTTGNASVGNLDTNIGAKADTSASSDTGTFSLIALVKRLLGKVPDKGSSNAAGSMPVIDAIETVTGNLVLNTDYVEITLNGASVLSIQLSGGSSSGLSVWFSNDGTNFVTYSGANNYGDLFNVSLGRYSTGMQPDGIYSINCGGFKKARVTGAAYQSGTTVVTLNAIHGAGLRDNTYWTIQAIQAISDNITISNTSLLSLDGKTPVLGINPPSSSWPVVLPKQQSITGVNAATSTTYNNLLDATGATATDVTAYSSVTLSVVSGASTGSYIVEGAFDSGFTIGSRTLQIFEETVQNANPIIAAITPTAATRTFKINTQGVNYLRVRLSTGVTSGALRAYAVLSQFPFNPAQLNVQQATAGSLNATVSIAATQTLATVTTVGSITTLPTLANVTTVASVTSGNQGIPSSITDAASAATGSVTTSTITPTFGTAYQVAIPVTAVTGSGIIDVVVQESYDGGTNWFNVYQFERISATGMYTSPHLRLRGSRVRYVQTLVSGTSVTRAILRLQTNTLPVPITQMYDRALVVGTISSKSATVIQTQGSSNLQLVCFLSVVGTLLVLNLEGSDDNTNWYTIPGTLTPGASAVSQLTVNNINAQFVRANVTTAGSGVTLGYIILKAF